MSISKSIARKFIFPFLHKLGYNQNLIRNNADKVLIVAYHGVLPNPDLSINYRHISLKEFKAHLDFYKQNFEVLSVEQIVNKEFKSNKPKLVITFDDAYKNIFKYAMPLLQEYGFYSSVYVVTNSLSVPHYLLWPDYIDILKKHKTPQIQFGTYTFTLKNNSYWAQNEEIEIVSYIKSLGVERDVYFENLKQQIIDLLGEKVFDDEYYRLINVDELRKYQQEFPLVIWGSHTTNHYNLGNIASDLVIEQLQLSKQILENDLKTKVNEIAYPDGSYTDFVYENGKIYPFQMAVKYNDSSIDTSKKGLFNRKMISTSTTIEANYFHIAQALKKEGIALDKFN